MIRISAGTECALGLRYIKTDVLPTTAYFMIGEKCINNCSFCAQSIKSDKYEKRLSRVNWQEYDIHQILECLRNDADYANNIKRLCFQVLHDKYEERILDELEFIIKQIRSTSDKPICVSIQVDNADDLERLLNSGVDKVTIAIDAVTSKLYRQIKKRDLQKTLEFLDMCSKKYIRRISTHLIVGIGETEEEMCRMIWWLRQRNIRPGIFAFTPIKGTEFENKERPSIGQYRRIQIAYYLIMHEHTTIAEFRFENGILINLNTNSIWIDKVKNSSGLAFMTSGCLDCNRPYYNESPNRTIYNYSRNLTNEEVAQAILESSL